MISAINRLLSYVRELIGFNPKVAPQKTINKLFAYSRELSIYRKAAEDDHKLIQNFQIKREQLIDELLSRKEEHSKAIKTEIFWLKLGKKDINPYDRKLGITLLHFVMEGFLDIGLLRYFSLRDLKKTGDLFASAIYHNNLEAINWLLNNRVSPDARDEDRDPMLHLAIMCDESHQIAKLLIAKGANINARDLDGKTPLLIALPRCKTEIIEFMLEKGANVHAKDKLNSSGIDKVFIHCERNGKEIIIPENIRLKTLSLLIEHGAKISKQSIQTIMYFNFQGETTKNQALLLMLGSAKGIEMDLTSYFVYQFFADKNNIKALFDTEGYELQKPIAKDNIFKNLVDYARFHIDQKLLSIAQSIFRDEDETSDKDTFINNEVDLSGDYDGDLEDIV
ncbi:hypothetical protein phytr_9300 [Candidatus Phycorickettsia trachydisci]|uniref:Uncharacterized protein n=1 Tax=Candidatus Phycorickettsia trachydisci TaxID=2115978 RepID=A0A2P1P9A4_9RICK|nr:ankyrin repeat domain-containing protein [Candidatus Phycorickettsia trachydisci]AVP87858.1 hypothetical protein phytr_9300 [Candidatus Phycorickettsia trachydisci]